MVNHYRMLMAEAKQEPITWYEIPIPGNVENGNDVPAAWAIPDDLPTERRVASLKSDDFFWSRMRWWDLQFKDATYLSGLTLGELGSLVEYSVHGDMHMRWSELPRDPDTNAPLPEGRPSTDYSEKWDNPKYDALLEFYSSHVNPIFWRLHGWIDDRIEDWYAAHERAHPGEVTRKQLGSTPWFEPGGKWVKVSDPWVWPKIFSGGHGGHEGGGMNNHQAGGMDGHDIDPEDRKRRIASIMQVLAILTEPEPPAAEALAAEALALGPTEVRSVSHPPIWVNFKLPT